MAAVGGASIVEFLKLVYKLKSTNRTGWVHCKVRKPETIASHMWGVALLSSIVVEPEIDRNKLIKLGLVHDVAECIAGDITPHDGISKEKKHQLEEEGMQQVQKTIGGALGQEMYDLWCEYEDGITKEAKIVKQADKLDMIMQARIYEQEDPTLDLEGFFTSTKGYITHPLLASVDSTIRQERATKNSPPTQKPTPSDTLSPNRASSPDE